MFRTAPRGTHRAAGRAVIDYRGLAAPVGRGVGGVAALGAVSATAALAGSAAATAQSSAPTSAHGAVRGAAPAPATPAPAAPVSAAPAPATQSSHTAQTLRLGSRGSAVTYLQQRLNAHGASLATDGVLGARTLQAVKSQQRSAGIGVDGVVGPLTWGSLTSSSSSSETSASGQTLRQGDRGGAVSTLQKELNASGASLAVDGVFGPRTASAVRALQTAAGLRVDTVVGTRTWSALAGDVRLSAGATGRDDQGSASTGSVNGAAVISAARAQLGVGYVWGGSSPAGGFDCSGLVYHAYNQAGIDLPRKTAKGYTFGGRIIAQSEAQPGDLVAFTGNDYGHMGIYLGNGRIIDASGSRQQVVERSIWSAPHVFVTYR
ncbi:peptidoglycan-binding protein [Brachybacterium sp. YJGR34]|uniref:C40 family peptidase n=1 Tax=Brachybacterium sp. YJGR34 TaxID=2059911 RepID=UPI000E0C0233|nr:peptidoglycan-binding protein [Brachybacterium sp. YJGR34]